MKRIAVFVGLSALTIAAFARGPVQPDRTETILRLMRERASQQHDVWFELGDFPRAVASLKILHEVFPHDYALETDLGWMQENVEQYGDAIGTYIAYRKAWPDDPEAYFPEAQFYFNEHLYAKVPPVLEPSLKLATRPHANSYRILASAYERMGLYADSLRIWDLYLSFTKDDPQAKLNRAKVERKRKGEQAPTNSVTAQPKRK